MKIEVIEDQHAEVIQYITQSSSVIYIDGELFALHEFIPNDNNIPKITVQGINITRVIHSHILGAAVTGAQQQALLTQIAEGSVERREYSIQHKWVLYSR